MSRHCARPACTKPAAATLTYDYRGRAAWLDDIADERHPMAHDLCVDHSDMSVPRGWLLEDRRVVRPLFGAAIAS
jgi:Protein of unknown function (DUF3499)